MAILGAMIAGCTFGWNLGQKEWNFGEVIELVGAMAPLWIGKS